MSWPAAWSGCTRISACKGKGPSRTSISSWRSSRWWARSCSWAGSCSGSCRARRDPLDELRHRRERERRLIAVRRVLAVGEHEALEGTGDAALDRIELGQGAVLVVGALDRQHRAAHAWQIGLDVPGAKGGI